MSKANPTILEAMSAAIDLQRAHSRLLAAPPAEVPEAIPNLHKRRPKSSWAHVQNKILPMVNNSGGGAPSLTLLKRVRTPDQKEGTMRIDDLLKSAVYNLERGNLSTAEQLLNNCERRIAKASVTHNHYYNSNGNDDDDDDNGTVTDTWSEAADSNAEGNNASLDDDDEDDEDAFVRKASYHHRIQGGAEPLPEPSKGTPMRSGDSSDTYSLGTTPATRNPTRHKFEALTDKIADEEGCPKTEAQSRARQRFPDVYTSYQSAVADSPTSAQHTRRAGHGVGKAMPMDYESLVSNEMLTKGVSWRTAETRIINQYGSTAFNDSNRMIKRAGSSIEAEFTRRANEIMDATGCERTEALRALRLQKRYLYDALNSV
jgi:hypothetical protein